MNFRMIFGAWSDDARIVVVATMAAQIIATSLRWASLSPSMYRCVVWIDRWPASSCTSRSEPPALWTMRAARVTNVRRPECDEQPFRPMFLNARLNHTTMLSGRHPAAALGRDHIIGWRRDLPPCCQSGSEVRVDWN